MVDKEEEQQTWRLGEPLEPEKTWAHVEWMQYLCVWVLVQFKIWEKIES